MIRARRARLLLALCALLGGGLAGYLALASRRAAPNILFVLVDTLRADRLGTYGRMRRLTPFLEDYGGRSLVFDRAYSASAWTLPAVVSLFVGQRPFDHGVVDFMIPLPDDQVTLAETLATHGYDTAGFVANAVISVPYGYNQGFATFELVGASHQLMEKPADATEVNAAALRWLDTRPGRRPFFLYLHYMEPHWPYRTHPGLTARKKILGPRDDVLGARAGLGNSIADEARRERVWTFPQPELDRLRDLYDGEVKYLDRSLADLFAELERRGTLTNTLVVITADHGEELGEHHIFGHGDALYESEIHVPLIVHLPGTEPGRRVVQPVETAGLAPALLRAAGIEPPATFRVPAVPFASDPTAPARWASPVSQLAKCRSVAIWLHRTAVIDANRKLLVAADGTLAVHDLRVDPAERHPLAPAAGDVARATALDRFDARSARLAATGPGTGPLLARLRALGYVGGPASDLLDEP